MGAVCVQGVCCQAPSVLQLHPMLCCVSVSFGQDLAMTTCAPAGLSQGSLGRPRAGTVPVETGPLQHPHMVQLVVPTMLLLACCSELRPM